MKKKLVVGLAFGLFVLGIAGMVDAIPVVDQSNVYYSGSASGPSVSSEYLLAQTVTNGITGNLVKLELFVTKHVSTSEDLIVQIRGIDGNQPSDDILIEKIIDTSDVGYTTRETIFIDYAQDNLFFNNGDIFSIVIYSQNDIDSEFNWWMPFGIDYQGGNGYRSSDNGASWVPIISENPFDFAFQTFIEPSPVPIPSSMLLFGTGLAGLAGWRLRIRAKG